MLYRCIDTILCCILGIVIDDFKADLNAGARLKSLLNEKSWPIVESWLVTLTENSILTIDFI